jgi:hypothetical protein
MMPFECCSQRMLNPFRGSMNCVRYRSADAVTADGVHWDIYVSNDGLLEDLSGRGRYQVSDIRFGAWSRDSGLQRGPIYPSEDFRRMERPGRRGYEHLVEVHDRGPFPCRDHVELWLLDRQARPLVLRDSALTPDEHDRCQSLHWLTGQNCRRSFTSAAAAELGIDTSTPGAVADNLGACINDRAGPEPAAQIFRRLPDGSGLGLDGINLVSGLTRRTLDAAALPVTLLEGSHHDASRRRLIADFINWQAPHSCCCPRWTARHGPRSSSMPACSGSSSRSNTGCIRRSSTGRPSTRHAWRRGCARPSRRARIRRKSCRPATSSWGRKMHDGLTLHGAGRRSGGPFTP